MRPIRTFAVFGTLVVLTACQDASSTSPLHSAHGSGTTSGSVFRQVASSVVGVLASFIETPMGQQPDVNPTLRIESPTGSGTVRRDAPVTIRVAYRDFDFRPELRTPNAGATLGSEPQVVVDGVVQGHIHGYLQRLSADGSIPEVESVSFCVLTTTLTKVGYSGVAEGDCPGVPAGDYRLSVEFQTNSHAAILKNGPRATPTADVLLIKVR